MVFRKYFSLLLIFVVLGCTQSPGASNAGVAIQNFYFKSAEIGDDELVSASFSVANVGSKTVSGDIYVWFYGPLFMSSNAWQMEPEGTIDLTSGEAVINGETFYPSIPENDIPGSMKNYDLLLRPPDVPDGATQSYTFYAEICYPYSTTALAEIVSVSENEFRVQKRTDPSMSGTENTRGPIMLTYSSRKDIRSSKQIPIAFTITDLGGGYATSPNSWCMKDISATERNRVEITVLVDGSPDGIDCGDYSNTATIDLVNNNGIAFCSYEVPDRTSPTRTHYVSAIARYMYYSRSTTDIIVEDSYYQ